jgi:hypothetical protein
MKTRFALFVVLMLALAASVVSWSQEDSSKVALQQKVAELKKNVAANRAKLAKYQWLQTTQVSIKGEVKDEQRAQCRYGPDGKVQKTPTASSKPAEEPKVPGGLRGKMAQKKIAEMKSYMERLKSLIGHYAPPNPERLQSELQAGKASLQLTAGNSELTFKDYYKQGDKVTFSYDTTAKRLTSYNVDTYLDDPQKDIVTLTNQFTTLPDGTNYLQETLLDAKDKEIQIKTTNSGHSLINH